MSLHILIVDPSSFATTLVKACSAAFGSNTDIIRTSSLVETKEYTDYMFDMILANINLPDKRGVNVLDQISMLFPNIPIVAISKEDSDDMVRGCIRHGATCFIDQKFENINIIRQRLLSIWERHLIDKRNDNLDVILEKFRAIHHQLEEELDDRDTPSIAS